MKVKCSITKSMELENNSSLMEVYMKASGRKGIWMAKGSSYFLQARSIWANSREAKDMEKESSSSLHLEMSTKETGIKIRCKERVGTFTPMEKFSKEIMLREHHMDMASSAVSNSSMKASLRVVYSKDMGSFKIS